MNQQSCFTGISAGVFNTNGKNLTGYQYWVSQSSSIKRTECWLMVTLEIQQERCGARMGKGHLRSIHHIINNHHAKAGVWCDFPCVLGLPKLTTQTNKQTKTYVKCNSLRDLLIFAPVPKISFSTWFFIHLINSTNWAPTLCQALH